MSINNSASASTSSTSSSDRRPLPDLRAGLVYKTMRGVLVALIMADAGVQQEDLSHQFWGQLRHEPDWWRRMEEVDASKLRLWMADAAYPGPRWALREELADMRRLMPAPIVSRGQILDLARSLPSRPGQVGEGEGGGQQEGPTAEERADPLLRKMRLRMH